MSEQVLEPLVPEKLNCRGSIQRRVTYLLPTLWQRFGEELRMGLTVRFP